MVCFNSLISLGRMSANLRARIPARRQRPEPRPLMPGQSKFIDPFGQKWVLATSPDGEQAWHRVGGGVMTKDQMWNYVASVTLPWR